MGFLDRPKQTSANPTSRFLEWKSNEKCFSYYNKETQTNELVKLPLTFIVLEEYHTVKGFNDADQVGIYSNEVLEANKEELEVKTFKGRVIAKGLIKNIKSTYEQAGGRYHKSIYAVTKEGELINISLRGACVSKWFSFTEKGAWKRLKDEWVTVEDVEEHKKGSVKYTTPNFKFNTSLSNQEFEVIKEKAQVLVDYMEGYFNKEEEEPVLEDANLDHLDI